ncbi:MAG: hypothetical protein JNM95_12310 [Chitinophagaceae bacterium]|nr:hypothetical protein [Chitinophagaceae bacterium]
MKNLLRNRFVLCLCIAVGLLSCTKQENEGHGNYTHYYGNTKAMYKHWYYDSSGLHSEIWDSLYQDAITLTNDPGIQKIDLELSVQNHLCASPLNYYSFYINAMNSYNYSYDSNTNHTFIFQGDSLKATFSKTIYSINDSTEILLLFSGKK